MRVSDAVIDRLAVNDVSVIFGIPGKQTLPLNEAVERTEGMRFVMARHETAVSHQAWGYAETSGRMAATLVVPGPGDMNAMNGLKNALNDNVPLLHLSVETDPEIRGGDGIHETPPETYDTVVKENILVETPESAPVEIERAIAVAHRPPKGPVRVGIPKGFLDRKLPTIDVGSFSREYVSDVPVEPLREASALLDSSSSPVIIAGGGVRASGATESLVAVAERLDAPVFTTFKGKGTFPGDHPLAAGMLYFASDESAFRCLERADTALAVGTDFDAVTTMRWSIPMPENLIHITLGADDIGFGYDPAVGIVCDASVALSDLVERIDDRSTTDGRPTGEERAETVRTSQLERIEGLTSVAEPPLTSAAALAVIRDAIPRETIVSADAGGFRIWTLLMFDAYGPRSYVNPGSWATMGTGLPAAIGARLANPGKPIVALTGDGGLMMCIHELHTLVAEQIPLTVVVFRNNDYAIISEDAVSNYRFQDRRYDWPHAPISFETVADGLGMDAIRAASPDEIREAMSEAIERDRPTLVEIPIDPSEPQAGDWMRNVNGQH